MIVQQSEILQVTVPVSHQADEHDVLEKPMELCERIALRAVKLHGLRNGLIAARVLVFRGLVGEHRHVLESERYATLKVKAVAHEEPAARGQPEIRDADACTSGGG